MFGALPARSWLSLYVILIEYRALIKNELKRQWVVHTQLTFRWNRIKQVYRYATESLYVRFCEDTTMRQHTMQKLHNMSYVSAYLKSTPPGLLSYPNYQPVLLISTFWKSPTRTEILARHWLEGAEKGDFRVPLYFVHFLAIQRLQSYWSQCILNHGYYMQTQCGF